jgi:hypothetical protein
MSAPFVCFDQHIIGDDVEFLLHFALHVFAAGRAHDITQFAAQRTFVHRMADTLAGTCHDLEQQAQL